MEGHRRLVTHTPPTVFQHPLWQLAGWDWEVVAVEERGVRTVPRGGGGGGFSEHTAP